MVPIIAYTENDIKKVAEGKTKEIFTISNHDEYVLIRSKNRITAFNAQRSNQIEGKGAIANDTTCNVFEYLNALGLKTHYVERGAENEFVALSCKMIPLEWVARRIATGSFLKRNPGVKEGYRFNPPKLEVFFKDDANNDPQWSEEQILEHRFEFNGLKIGKREINSMKRQTDVIFRVLEKAWNAEGCTLIDLKVEFGVTKNGELVLADVIDNDSWRVWPAGDRRLQLDKQFYRDLKQVDDAALSKLKENYQTVAHITKNFIKPTCGRVVVLMGSTNDMEYASRICDGCKTLGIAAIKRVSSAHKTTENVLEIIAEYEGDSIPTVFVATAGRSNGLGLVIAGNSALPVINAPPLDADWAAKDIWSSVHTPSGLGCSTVLGADEAALAAAKTLAINDYMIFGRLLVKQFDNFAAISVSIQFSVSEFQK
uniref:AIRC domain-containing protein n=1 Tax=Ascaris lumbricoides TaxID=6252 RepID=A0A0M3HVK1_ASCLU